MAGNGGIGGGSVKVYLNDADPGAPSSAKAAGGPNSHGRGRADASVGNHGNPSVTITFTFTDGTTKVDTLAPGQEVTFVWQ